MGAACPLHLGPCDGASCAWWLTQPWAGCALAVLARAYAEFVLLVPEFLAERERR